MYQTEDMDMGVLVGDAMVVFVDEMSMENVSDLLEQRIHPRRSLPPPPCQSPRERQGNTR